MIVVWNDLKEYAISVGPHRMGGHQIVFRFPNGYGASVIRTPFCGRDGLMELGVLIFDGDEYELTYDTYLAGDVIGRLDSEECIAILHQIKALPKECKKLESQNDMEKPARD